MQKLILGLLVLIVLGLSACEIRRVTPERTSDEPQSAVAEPTMQERVDGYRVVRLTTDLPLSESDRQVLPLLLEAADLMDEVFWLQAYGDPADLPSADRTTRQFIDINYGPWDRLSGNAPFVDGVGPKPLGANFYPADVTREDIQAAADHDPAILDLYTLVRRDEAGNLITIPYHEVYSAHHTRAATLLLEAAELAEDEDFKRYLELRADALLSDTYQESDRAWLDMRTNTLDLIIGPIEVYEDLLFGAKAAHEAYILVKDQEWSARLARYAELLPALQAGLPVPEAYRSENPGSDADLGAYDVIYYAGASNAGAKTIAVNLPNDEQVQLEKGTRRLQLKNAMQAKFDHILIPIADLLIASEQRNNITFDAFFENVMFHEVAHGLGIKNLIDGSGWTVREALREHASALEESKADVLGLYMVSELSRLGELEDGHNIENNHVTFLASIFRSSRFGSSSAHGIANLIAFNFFLEHGAFSRNEDGQYVVDHEAMAEAVSALAEALLRLQGDGDLNAVNAFVERYGIIGNDLRTDLDRIHAAGIPIDIVFEQGTEVLGL